MQKLAASGGLSSDDEISEEGHTWISARNVRGLLSAGESASLTFGDAVDDRPFDVFITYSHQNKLEAEVICGKLETMGIRCWIAPRDILPGSGLKRTP